MSAARSSSTTKASPQPRIGRRAGVLAVAVALLVAGPASAHPFVRGGELPVDSSVTMTLAMAHGCDSETSGEGEPTTQVSMEVPEWLRVVEVPEEAGWSVGLEDDDGVPEVVTWTADGAEEPAPDFELDVVAMGEIGEERYLRVFQACDEFVYRWVGTPEDPADDPAIRVTLTEADPDAPPPPEPEPTEEPEPEPTEEPTDEADPEDAREQEAAPDAEPSASRTDDAGLPGWLLPTIIVVLLGTVVLLIGRRGRTDA